MKTGRNRISNRNKKNADMTILQRVGDIIRNADQLIMTVKCKSVGSDLWKNEYITTNRIWFMKNLAYICIWVDMGSIKCMNTFYIRRNAVSVWRTPLWYINNCITNISILMLNTLYKGWYKIHFYNNINNNWVAKICVKNCP